MKSISVLPCSTIKCHIKETKTSKIYLELREATIIPEEFSEDENGMRLLSLRAFRVPIANEAFVTEWLDIKRERVESNMLELGKLLDPIRIASRDILSRQCLWLLILIYLQFEVNYCV